MLKLENSFCWTGHLYCMLCLSDSIGKKAYPCQKCSVSRDEEEIKKMRSEILLLLDKASSFLSSGSILVYD